MNENILVLGAKNNLVDQLSLESEKYEDKIYFVKDSGEKTWNRASPISARSNLLQVKNLFGEIHKAFIIYDSSDFIRFNTFDVESISKSVDFMTLGYSYISSEILNCFSEQGFGELIFVFLDNEEREKSILEKIGIAGFLALAEGIAMKKASKQLGITLIKAESENFENNVEWMFSYLENVNSKKASCSAKHAVKWVKVGSKPPVILPFGK